MHQAMRRYVPGAIAERIEHGDALEAGEREVTVLFVDVRDFTALSEGEAARRTYSRPSTTTRGWCPSWCGTPVEPSSSSMATG